MQAPVARLALSLRKLARRHRTDRRYWAIPAVGSLAVEMKARMQAGMPLRQFVRELLCTISGHTHDRRNGLIGRECSCGKVARDWTRRKKDVIAEFILSDHDEDNRVSVFVKVQCPACRCECEVACICGCTKCCG